jgi:hypothetical protein
MTIATKGSTITCDPEKLDHIGILGQWFAGVIVGVGIGIEVALQADLGFLAISLGSLVYAAMTKIRKI